MKIHGGKLMDLMETNEHDAPAGRIFLAAAGILLLFAAHVWYLRAIPDDAYISFRYARNFAEGNGLVWNPGETPVEGYTNFFWIMLLAVLYKTGAPLVQASRVLSFLFAVLTLPLVYAVTRRLNEARVRDEATVAMLILALSSPFAFWASSGMEMTLFTFLIFLGSYFYLRNEASPASSIAFFLAALTRPEGIFVFGLTACHLLFLRIRRREKLIDAKVISFLCFFVVPYAIYFFWRYNYYGYLLPNTFYTKVGSTASQFVRGIKYAAAFFIVSVLPALLFLGAFKPKRAAAESYFAAIIAAYTLYIIAVGGDYMTMFRFFVPLTPYFAVLIARTLFFLIRRFRPRFRAAIVTALALIFVLPSFNLEALSSYIPAPPVYWRMRYNAYPRIPFQRYVSTRLALIGQWIGQNIPEDRSVAFEGIGAIGYFSRSRIYDMLGLNDAHIAHLNPANMGKGMAGHEKQDFLYILSKEPDYILFSRKFLQDSDKNLSLETLYGGRLEGYSERERELALQKLHRNYRLQFVPMVDSRNHESGYLLFLRRIDQESS